MRRILALVVGGAMSVAVAEGLFSDEQVGPGNAVYKEHCQVCHGDKLLSGEMGGPPLSGAFFFNRWEGKTVGELYAYTQEFMPFGQGGLLSKTEYSDVVAFILHYNGFEAGDTKLSPDSDVMQMELAKPAAE